MLPLIMGAISAGTSIYNAVKGAKKDKEATKQSAKAQGLAVQGDAQARAAATERYKALDPFRNAATSELARGNLITPDKYNAVTDGKYQGQTDAALKAATQGLDRTALTRQALADYDTANARGLGERFRAVGSNASKFGRLGMQVNEQAVKDVGNQYEQDRMLMANDLIRGATEAQVGDRYKALDATTGLNQSDLGLQERNRSFDYGTKRDAVGDRGNAIDRAQGLANTGYDNGQVINTATDNNTIAALGVGTARNDTAAANYGQAAGDAASAAGRFLALPRNNAPVLNFNPALLPLR